MKRLIALLAALTFSTLGFSATGHAYTDNGDGTGYVGKGEVQTLLGFNNKQMQAAHQQITFVYEATADVSFTCEWTTGEGTKSEKTHTNVKTETNKVTAAIADADRKTGQWTGWNISGLGGSTITESDITAADCGAEGNEMKSVVPSSITVTNQSGGLYAVYNSKPYLLTLTPATVV